MKTVLWKPFRRWTGTLYSNWTSSYRGTKSHHNIPTTSQDPIVDGSLTGDSGYHLQNMDIEKAAYYGRKQDPTILERAIAQLPGANHNLHPHHTPCNKKNAANAASGEHPRKNEHTQQLPQTVYNPLPHTGINKETSIHVSHTNNTARRQPQTRSRAPSAAQLSQRPRHQPLIPFHQDNVTPRTLDEIYSSRINGSAALAPSSPAPDTVSQNTTAPLTPMTPSSLYSTDIDSVQSPPPPRNKRHGGTFFFA